VVTVVAFTGRGERGGCSDEAPTAEDVERVGIGDGYPPPQSTRRSGERHGLISGVWVGAPAKNEFGAL